MAKHPKKSIREAITHAEQRGWTFAKAGPRAHIFGTLRCQFGHRECLLFVYSTPRSPDRHARDIRRAVDRCPGAGEN